MSYIIYLFPPHLRNLKYADISKYIPMFNCIQPSIYIYIYVYIYIYIYIYINIYSINDTTILV